MMREGDEEHEDTKEQQMGEVARGPVLVDPWEGVGVEDVMAAMDEMDGMDVMDERGGKRARRHGELAASVLCGLPAVLPGEHLHREVFARDVQVAKARSVHAASVAAALAAPAPPGFIKVRPHTFGGGGG